MPCRAVLCCAVLTPELVLLPVDTSYTHNDVSWQLVLECSLAVCFTVFVATLSKLRISPATRACIALLCMAHVLAMLHVTIFAQTCMMFVLLASILQPSYAISIQLDSFVVVLCRLEPR